MLRSSMKNSLLEREFKYLQMSRVTFFKGNYKLIIDLLLSPGAFGNVSYSAGGTVIIEFFFVPPGQSY